MKDLHQKLKQKPRLALEDIPVIAKSENSDPLLWEIWGAIQQATENGNLALSSNGLIAIFWSLFKWKLALFVLLMTAHVIIQIFFGYFLQKILSALVENSINNAYIWATALCISIAFDIILRNHYYFHSIRFGTKFRCAIITILYWKIISLNSFSMRAANLEKLINIVANDLNNIEFKICFLPIIVATPIILCIFIFFIWNLFGWTSLLGILIFIILSTVKQILLKSNSSIINQRNLHSDARIKLCHEAIEGIRLIKMYAWEASFRKSVDELRRKEISALKRYNFVFYIDRALSVNSSYFAAFFVFIAYYYSGLGVISSLQVFSFIQYFESLRLSCLTDMALAASFFFEAPVS